MNQLLEWKYQKSMDLRNSEASSKSLITPVVRMECTDVWSNQSPTLEDHPLADIALAPLSILVSWKI